MLIRIQYTLEEHSNHLLQHGVLYPQSGRISQSSPVHHALFNSAGADRQHKTTQFSPPEKTFEEHIRDVKEEWDRSAAQIIFFSSERLWDPKRFNEDALFRIRDAFHDCDFRVLAYLRPMESRAVSGYSQRVTGQEHFDKSFRQHLSQLKDCGRYSYLPRLRKFAKVFGDTAVSAIWLPWLKGDVLAPFREIAPGFDGVIVRQPLNERKRWTSVSVIRRLNSLERLGLKRLRNLGVRSILKYDRHLKKNSVLENFFFPLDRNTSALLEKKTDEELRSLLIENWILNAKRNKKFFPDFPDSSKKPNTGQ